jgi:predicted ATP-grasp superfamily ATP-dependent carboligase
MTRRATHLVMPASVGSWFAHFLAPPAQQRVAVLGEAPAIDVGEVLDTLEAAGADRVILHSGHDTLLRDRALAGALASHGYRSVAQSARATAIGLDKRLMKEFFDQHGFAGLPWTTGERLPTVAGDPLVVVKARHGTQSRGTMLARLSGHTPGPDEIAELYADGTEYSMVVFRDGDRTVTLPPIWKGRTSTELVPPWRRLRVCPHAPIDAGLEDELRASARAIAAAADAVGLIEIEYLVTDDDRVNVLEINPRISGTMRLAAMATGVPIFSLYDNDMTGDLLAVAHGAEIPYRGAPVCDPAGGVFATSRLTVVADDPARALDKLRRHGGVAAEPAAAAA